ncbi:MAG: hypothetical protein HC895_02510 [Leptolyngbyaceae cyanobacterium SM1_3_5]|nr:hypothetical protein [Leptolyngbyaceae cyanobacterium SM1_3_5]
MTTFLERCKPISIASRAKNVLPEDFIGVAEEVSGEELDGLFDTWFYSEELASLPTLNLFAGSLENDTLYGSGTGGTLAGLDGNDTLYGNGGANTLIGNSGDDLIYGGSTAERILGGAGNDTIYANGGNDFIDSGAGFDTVWLGGGGSATVLIRTTPRSATTDDFVTIKNFQLGSTRLQVSGGIRSNTLTFVDSADGVQIRRGNDVLAVVAWQTASTFNDNRSLIFR